MVLQGRPAGCCVRCCGGRESDWLLGGGGLPAPSAPPLQNTCCKTRPNVCVCWPWAGQVMSAACMRCCLVVCSVLLLSGGHALQACPHFCVSKQAKTALKRCGAQRTSRRGHLHMPMVFRRLAPTEAGFAASVSVALCCSAVLCFVSDSVKNRLPRVKIYFQPPPRSAPKT